MSAYPNALEMQRQNEMRRIAEAQNRLAMLDQQAQMQAQQNQYMGQNMNYGQPQVQFLGLSGKFVQSMDNFTPNDVPMDGSVAFFPRQDMTEIYARAWQADGSIKTVVFKPVEPVIDAQANNSTPNGEKLKFDLSDDATEAFMKRFDDITERLEKMEKNFSKPTGSRGKKEVETDE